MTNVERAMLSLYTAHCSAGNGSGVELILPPSRTHFYGYGRQALAEGLRRVGVGPNDVVLLPGFICHELLASVHLVGAVPRFYKVDETLGTDADSLECGGAGKVGAVVAVNYFGFPQALEPIREWCRAHGGVALIEDNAHGFLSSDGEVPLGRRGDLGVFSLRKTLFLPNGAALVDNRYDRMDGDELSFRGSCRSAEWLYRAKLPVKRLIESTGLGGARIILGGVRKFRQTVLEGTIPDAIRGPECVVPQTAVSPLTARLLRRCDLFAESRRRRSLFQTCRQLFSDVADVWPLFNCLPDGVVPYGFPFLYMGKDRNALMKDWWRQGIPILSWPGHFPSAIQLHALDHYRRVMFVPFLW